MQDKYLELEQQYEDLYAESVALRRESQTSSRQNDEDTDDLIHALHEVCLQSLFQRNVLANIDNKERERCSMLEQEKQAVLLEQASLRYIAVKVLSFASLST